MEKPTKAQIDQEIQDRIKQGDRQFGEGGTFLPEEYRKRREAGYSAREIDYDMCHVWR